MTNIANSPTSIYTSHEITGYYAVKTQYLCQCCGGKAEGPLSQEVIVTYGSISGDANHERTLPLQDLIVRYQRLFPNKSDEQIWNLIPQHPIVVRKVWVQVKQCEQCLPAMIGRLGASPMLPVELPTTAPIASPNANFDQRAREAHKQRVKGKTGVQVEKKKRKSKSRFANPKRKESREEYLQRKEREQKLNAMQGGGNAAIDALLNF